MQYPLLSEYVSAIANAGDNLAQLKHLEVVPDQHGEPYRSSGAFAVVFKMQDPRDGKLYALKCFTEEQEGRAEAYRRICEELEYVRGSYFPSLRYYEGELFVDSSVSDSTEFPVLLMDWVEGETMEVYISKHYRDAYKMAMLCHSFCRLGSWLRSQPFAHGDIKPDNIIVDDRGSLTLIDCDGMYVPSMAGEPSPTMGTQDFRHPLRTSQHFDASIDDFALASIALSLKAISLDPSLLDRYGAPDRLLFSAGDYLDLSRSALLSALLPLASDRDLAKLLSLFLLAHAEQSLTATAFHLFSTARPERPAPIELLSTEVTDEDLAEAYIDEYGVKLSPDRKRLLQAPFRLKSYIVPDSVTTICNGAFCCGGLSEISLPSSLTSIGDSAFELCSLKEIELPQSLKTIEGNPFGRLEIRIINRSPHFYSEDDVLFTSDKTRLIAFCSKSSSYEVPYTVTSIANGAFSGCRGLREISLPSSLTSIGDSVFSECSGLSGISLPSSLTSIGEWAFSSCSGLSEISLPSSLTSIGARAFSSCSGLTEISLPSSLTSIGNGAFQGCSGLREISFPSSLTSIGVNAFYGCSGLKEIELPASLKDIVGNPFPGLEIKIINSSPHFYLEDDVLFTSDKTRLIALLSRKSSYQVPDSVTCIGASAFLDCSGLTEISFPFSLTSIGARAFLRCSGLTKISFPSSLTSIGVSAFEACDELSEATREELRKRFGKSVFW